MFVQVCICVWCVVCGCVCVVCVWLLWLLYMCVCVCVCNRISSNTDGLYYLLAECHGICNDSVRLSKEAPSLPPSRFDPSLLLSALLTTPSLLLYLPPPTMFPFLLTSLPPWKPAPPYIPASPFLSICLFIPSSLPPLPSSLYPSKKE